MVPRDPGQPDDDVVLARRADRQDRAVEKVDLAQVVEEMRSGRAARGRLPHAGSLRGKEAMWEGYSRADRRARVSGQGDPAEQQEQQRQDAAATDGDDPYRGDGAAGQQDRRARRDSASASREVPSSRGSPRSASIATSRFFCQASLPTRPQPRSAPGGRPAVPDAAATASSRVASSVAFHLSIATTRSAA